MLQTIKLNQLIKNKKTKIQPDMSKNSFQLKLNCRTAFDGCESCSALLCKSPWAWEHLEIEYTVEHTMLKVHRLNGTAVRPQGIYSPLPPKAAHQLSVLRSLTLSVSPSLVPPRLSWTLPASLGLSASLCPSPFIFANISLWFAHQPLTSL